MTPFSFVLVAYNSGDVIGDAIRSIPGGNQIIVVDNASSDDSVEIARACGATVVSLGSNLGFGTACNRGAEIALHERLFFLNPDARLEPGSLEALNKAFLQYPDAAAFNPKFLNEDGSRYFRRRTKLLPRPYFFRPPMPDKDKEIEFVSGAAILIRKSVFDQIGGFDENIFLYFEDDDLSARVIKAGHKMRYVNQAEVRHITGTSSPQSKKMSELKEYHFMKAKIYTYRKHGVSLSILGLSVREKIRKLSSSMKKNENSYIRATSRLKAIDEFRKSERHLGG